MRQRESHYVKWPRVLGAVSLLVTLGVLSSSSSAFARTTHSQGTTKITLGVPPTIITGTPFLADSWGYFAKQGLAPTFISSVSGTLLAQAMIAGSINISCSSFYLPMQLNETPNLKAHFELINGVTKVQTLALLVPVNSTYKTLADLMGKRIGVAAIGSAQETSYKALLSEHHLNPNGVTYVPVGVGATAVAAFRHGEVDALFTSDPGIQFLTGSHEARIIIDLRTGKGGPIATLPSVGCFAQEAFIKAHPGVVKGFVIAMSQALKREHDHPLLAAKTFDVRPEFKTAGGTRVIHQAVVGDAPGLTPVITPKMINNTSSILRQVAVLKYPHTWNDTVASQFSKYWDTSYPGEKTKK